LPLFLPVRPSFWVTGADGEKWGKQRNTQEKDGNGDGEPGENACILAAC